MRGVRQAGCGRPSRTNTGRRISAWRHLIWSMQVRYACHSHGVLHVCPFVASCRSKSIVFLYGCSSSSASALHKCQDRATLVLRHTSFLGENQHLGNVVVSQPPRIHKQTCAPITSPLSFVSCPRCRKRAHDELDDRGLMTSELARTAACKYSLVGLVQHKSAP